MKLSDESSLAGSSFRLGNPENSSRIFPIPLGTQQVLCYTGVMLNGKLLKGIEMLNITRENEQVAMGWINLWQEVGGEDTLETFVRDLVTEPRGVQEALRAHVQMMVDRGRATDGLEMLVESLLDEIERRHQAATC